MSAPTEVNREGLSVPPWVLLDDDGERVLVVNALDGPARPVFLPNRELFHRVMSRLAPDNTAPWAQEERDLLADLRMSGALLATSEVADLRADVEAGNGPGGLFLGRLSVEIDGRVSEPDLDERLTELGAWFEREGRLPDTIALRITHLEEPEIGDWARWATVAERLRRLVVQSRTEEADKQKVSVTFDIPLAPSAVDDGCFAFIETYGGFRGTVVWAAETHEASARACARLASEGFAPHVIMRTEFGEDLAVAVSQLLEKGGVTSVEIAPKWDVDEVARMTQQVDSALTMLGPVTRALGVAANRSEPWSSLLVSAFVPLRNTVAWSKKRASLHLGANGRWSRSVHHAERGWHDSFDVLMPHGQGKLGDAWYDSRLSAHTRFDGAPACANCSLAALCDRFWSPELDALMREGAQEAARELARFACSFREATLDALIDSVRVQHMDVTAADGPTMATFADGELRFTTSPP